MYIYVYTYICIYNIYFYVYKNKNFVSLDSGLSHWKLQRLSAILIIPLIVWFIINFVSIYDKNFDEVLVFVTKESSKFLLSILMIVAFFFSALSISEIFEDYVHDEKIKNISIKLLYSSAIIIPFLTIIVIYNLNI